MIKNTQQTIEPPTTSGKLWAINIYNIPVKNIIVLPKR
jgi:hypothetical protein